MRLLSMLALAVTLGNAFSQTPTAAPTEAPTAAPTYAPTAAPTSVPTTPSPTIAEGTMSDTATAASVVVPVAAVLVVGGAVYAGARFAGRGRKE